MATHTSLCQPVDDARSAGGLGFFVHRRLLESFASVELEAAGRACRMATPALSGPEGDQQIHDVHMDHACPTGRMRDVQALRRITRRSPHAHHAILGDFNFVCRCMRPCRGCVGPIVGPLSAARPLGAPSHPFAISAAHPRVGAAVNEAADEGDEIVGAGLRSGGGRADPARGLPC